MGLITSLNVRTPQDRCADIKENAMSEQMNPYAAPKAVVADVGSAAHPQAEAVRREHINHEASIKAVGTLYYIGGFLGALGALVMLFPLFAAATDKGVVGIAIVGLLATISAVYIVVGRGLRSLHVRARNPTIIL